MDICMVLSCDSNIKIIQLAKDLSKKHKLLIILDNEKQKKYLVTLELKI